MERFYLERPSIDRKAEAIEYINEFIENNSEIHGVGSLHKYLENYESWLKHLQNMRDIKEIDKLVPAETFFLIRENDNKIVGMIDIRLALNDFLNNNPITQTHRKMTKIVAVIFIAIFAMAFIGTIGSLISHNNARDRIKENQNAVVDDMDNFMSEFDITRFNSSFEMYMGTEYGSSVGRLLDEIITNNKKNEDNLVTVKFKETNTKDPEEIKNLKKQLDEWTKYEVSFEYDDDGLIYLATIEE